MVTIEKMKEINNTVLTEAGETASAVFWYEKTISPNHIIKTNTKIRDEILNIQSISSPVGSKLLNLFTDENSHSRYAIFTVAKMYKYFNRVLCATCQLEKCGHDLTSVIGIIVEHLSSQGYMHLKIPHMRNHKISYHYSSNGFEGNEVKEFLIYTTLDSEGYPFLKFSTLTYTEYYVNVEGEYSVYDDFSEGYKNNQKLLQSYQKYSYADGMLSDFNGEPALETNLIVSHWNQGRLALSNNNPTMVGYGPAISDEALRYGETELYDLVKMSGLRNGKRTPRLAIWVNRVRNETINFHVLRAEEKFL